jgi:hypothetical protein
MIMPPPMKNPWLLFFRESLKTQKIEANEGSKSKSRRGTGLVKAAEKVNEHAVPRTSKGEGG